MDLPEENKEALPPKRGALTSDPSEFAKICAEKLGDLHERARLRGYWTLDELVIRLQMLRLQHGGTSKIRGQIFIYPEGVVGPGGLQEQIEYHWLRRFNMERTRKHRGYRTKKAKKKL